VILVTRPYHWASSGVLVDMNSPRVIELPRRLEPVSRDPFLEGTGADVVELRPRVEATPLRHPAPQPPLRAA
jgi:hypothetical protein